jgi:hypothetical protein
MNCQSFESIVNDLAREQIMEANLREHAFAHLVECEACTVRLQDEQELMQALRALAAEMNGAEAPSRIEEHLLVAFRKHKFAQPHLGAIHHWRLWATAAAAVLLIVLGIIAMRSRPMSSSAQNPQSPKLIETGGTGTNAKALAAVEESKPVTVPKQEVTSAIPSPKQSANLPGLWFRSATSRGRKNTLAARTATTPAESNSENEIATDFLPLGYTSPMSLQDGGQVVRVELPRTALATFGLPVNMNRANERVKADVLVGADGQARAIRFVQ